MNNLTLLVLLGSAVLIAALALYALHLWRRVWAQEKIQTQALNTQRERIGGDLRILASSLLEGQLQLIEGAIRIKVLLDNYDSSLSQDPRCEVFHLLFTATAQVPTHADWKEAYAVSMSNVSVSLSCSTRPPPAQPLAG